MGTNSFLIEIVFKADAASANAVLASKLSNTAGYELEIGADGSPRLTLVSGVAKASATSSAKVTDGKWHHLLVEANRPAETVNFYLDGKPAGLAKLDTFFKEATLSNTADFTVGKGLVGAIDFLRVCRSTLAESKTSIEELYAWEFDGPFLRDFAGKPAAGKRDAGAIGG
jgi:hypothetical protein